MRLKNLIMKCNLKVTSKTRVALASIIRSTTHAVTDKTGGTRTTLSTAFSINATDTLGA